MLSHIAKDLKIHLVGGSIPESCDGKLYNTAAIFGPDGTMVAKFRKVREWLEILYLFRNVLRQ